jgi:hypothetical protein
MRWLVFLIPLLLSSCEPCYPAVNFTDKQIANAIYKAEGGDNTCYPYGILKHYKHTTPRQACLNTICHARLDYVKCKQDIDFIQFLGNRYCPVGCENDIGTNRYWIKNVKYFLKKGGNNK